MSRQRGNGSGSLYHVKGRKKPWVASVTVGWTLEGRPIRRARYAASKTEALTVLREMTDARALGLPMPDDRMTVSKWAQQWYASLTGLRPLTVVSYRRSLELLLPHLGGIPLRKLRSPAIEAALAQLSEGSRQAARTVLGTCLKDAQRAGHVPSNEASLARVKVTRKKLLAPTPDEMRAVLSELAGHRLSAIFVLMAHTGLRLGEAMGLRWEDVGEEYLTVSYQLQRIDGEYVHTPPKTADSRREAAITPTLRRALDAHKARQNEERLLSGRDWRRADLVFCRPDGEPLAHQTVQYLLERACVTAGVRHLSPHSFRRFALTQVEEALGREAAQRLGGHTDPRTTALYVSTTRKMLADAADALEAVG